MALTQNKEVIIRDILEYSKSERLERDIFPDVAKYMVREYLLYGYVADVLEELALKKQLVITYLLKLILELKLLEDKLLKQVAHL